MLQHNVFLLFRGSRCLAPQVQPLHVQGHSSTRELAFLISHDPIVVQVRRN
jgi:hypothetical protein